MHVQLPLFFDYEGPIRMDLVLYVHVHVYVHQTASPGFPLYSAVVVYCNTGLSL